MTRGEYLTCVNLHKALKDRIKGKIFTTINEGTLTVNINAVKGFYYTTNINNLAKHVNVEYMANDIMHGYRKFILEKFFNT